MTTSAPDLNRLQHLRLFSPMATLAVTAWGHDSSELDAQIAVMVAFVENTPNPHCLLCEHPLGAPAPALMGWQDMPGGKAVFAVCQDCGGSESRTKNPRQNRLQADGARRQRMRRAPQRWREKRLVDKIASFSGLVALRRRKPLRRTKNPPVSPCRVHAPKAGRRRLPCPACHPS